MFKKGVITDEISQDLEAAVDLAAKYNLDGIEIRSIWEKGPHELSSDDIVKIRKTTLSANLEICCISTPFFKCDIDNTEEIKEHMSILRKCIGVANSLGTKLIRGFTFWNRNNFEENIDKIVIKFEETVKLLEKENIIMVLESDPSVLTTNAEKLVKVVGRINSPYVKALWDPGNDIYDPDGEVPFPHGYKLVKPYIAHMHLKDALRLPDGKIMGVPLGEGQVDYRGQFKELIDNGYNGYVVLETHYRPEHEISEELLALPKGSAFSHLGYEATEECLVKWNRLLDDIIKDK